MFADYLFHRRTSSTKSTTKLSKIHNSLRYKTIHDLVINLTKIGLSQAKRRTPTHARVGPLSRDSQHKGCAEFVNHKSARFSQIPAKQVPGLQIRRTRLQRGPLCLAASRSPKSTLSRVTRLLDRVPHINRWRTVSIDLLHYPISDSANLFRGLPRTNITFPNKKNDVLNKFERMGQH